MEGYLAQTPIKVVLKFKGMVAAFQNTKKFVDRSSTGRGIFILADWENILFGPKYFCSLALNRPSGLDFEPKVDLNTGSGRKSRRRRTKINITRAVEQQSF